MLDVKNLSYRYGMGAPVLRNISLQIADGERLALLGPSGRGKSTLALLLAGYLPLQEGSIALDGAALPKGGYNPIQLIYQHPEKAMDPRWKVKDSLSEAWDVPDELLRAIGIEPDWLTRWPNELSGGQLQRLSILRALSPKTRVLIADEITASLDPITQAQIWSVILQEVERHDMILIAITHNEALAQRICTRMVHVDELQG
ncbi:ATP-binding cassette domain-containing protein [uncultured Selenomonas sp.]|uniref:ABC transporter ATP-binding protein n=1 Tax=uncultured Selenomonas sp. TaxID=159275 RepID=UPI0028DBCF89|nr:ATP-binding cassette domain-containing protein [uncultured Selenomonas sp.]